MEEFDLFADGFEETVPAGEMFLETLSFSAIPFLTALIFALIAPPLGATLSMRNETVSAITLPVVGTAIMALFIAMGIHPDQTVILYPLTVLSLFAVMTLLHLYVSRSRRSGRYRSLILSALFVGSQTLILLVKEKSHHVENLFDTLLEGDLLVGSNGQLIAAVVVAIILLLIGIRFRGYLYTFSLDADLLKSQQRHYKRTLIIHRLSVALVVTGGILFMGPLLTMGLFILPGFLTERYSRGLTSFFIGTIVVSLIGTAAGLVLSIKLSMSPAPVAVCGIGVCALAWRYVGKFRS